MSTKRQDWITVDAEGYDKNLFNIPYHYKKTVSKVLIPAGLIDDRTEKLAYDIHQFYLKVLKDTPGESVLALCTLKGAYRFFGDLLKKIEKINSYSPENSVPIKMDFIRLKSYENDESTGDVKVVGGDKLQRLKGKHVLVVEDIVDTGKTMLKLLEILEQVGPASVKVAALALKKTPKSVGYIPDYVGFEVPDLFIVGCAFDYNEHYRDLNHVCVINDYGKENFKLKN